MTALLFSRASGPVGQKVYGSRRWREHVRPQKLARDPYCQAVAVETGPDGWPVTKQCRYLAEHVDHWQPLSNGGDAWADGNLISLCHGHHSEKTAAEQNGKPVPFTVTPSAKRVLTLA